MKLRQFIATSAVALLCAAIVSTSAIAQENSRRQGDDGRRGDRHEDQTCLPGIERAARQYPVYWELYANLLDNRWELKGLLNAVADQTSYEALLVHAESVAAAIDGGRMVVTLPDGTVVLDTAVEDDPTNSLPAGNSYAHFSAKTVNENHNSRVAILSAQLYPCGVGLESKLSTTTDTTESYVAIRLGKHLNSLGTARLSTAAQTTQSQE